MKVNNYAKNYSFNFAREPLVSQFHGEHESSRSRSSSSRALPTYALVLSALASGFKFGLALFWLSSQLHFMLPLPCSESNDKFSLSLFSLASICEHFKLCRDRQPV